MDIPRPPAPRGFDFRFLIAGFFLCLFVFGGFYLPNSAHKAKETEKKQEESVEQYVSVKHIGRFRGSWAYLVTDKAGNEWFVSENIAIPIKK